jgi:hypothetical protein
MFQPLYVGNNSMIALTSIIIALLLIYLIGIRATLIIFLVIILFFLLESFP